MVERVKPDYRQRVRPTREFRNLHRVRLLRRYPNLVEGLLSKGSSSEFESRAAHQHLTVDAIDKIVYRAHYGQ